MVMSDSYYAFNLQKKVCIFAAYITIVIFDEDALYSMHDNNLI